MSQTKTKQILEHREKIFQCHRCELRDVYDHPVPPIGNPDAKIMLVGEAPGADEVAQTKPFVGASGKMLRKALIDGGIGTDEVFISNVLCCRPKDNKFPTNDSIVQICVGHIYKEIEIIQPTIVVAIGGKAHSALKPDGASITRACGDWESLFLGDDTYHYMATLHPSFCMKGGDGTHANPIMAMSSKERIALFRQHIASIKDKLEELGE